MRIRAACIFGGKDGKMLDFLRLTLKGCLNHFLTVDDHLFDQLEEILSDEKIKAGKAAVLELARYKPIIIAVDTLENYNIHDDAMMRASKRLKMVCKLVLYPTRLLARQKTLPLWASRKPVDGVGVVVDQIVRVRGER